MGLIQKKEEHDVIEGIEVIERSDNPDDLPQTAYDLVAGKSAEDIAAEGDADVAEDDAPAADSASDDADHEDKATAPRRARRAAQHKKDDDSEGNGSGSSSDGGAKGRGHAAAFIVIAVVAVIVAGIAGYAAGSGMLFGGSRGAEGTSLSEDQLDTVVARYTYQGATTDVTARQLLEAQYSLDTVKQDDGTYPTPSADLALSYVRNQILLDEADARGITVSDDEMTSFAEESIGVSDYATMAEQYGVTEDQAKEIVRQQATMQKLYDQIVPEITMSVPEAPTEPENGDSSTRSKDYADYIIGLAGDEWDSETGTWASQDGPYYQALSGTDFSADSASYEEALTAYYTAYQEYSEASSEANSTWSEFQNGLYANADVDLYGLFR